METAALVLVVWVLTSLLFCASFFGLSTHLRRKNKNLFTSRT